MKKTIQLFTAAIAMLLLSSFIPKPNTAAEPMYYVVSAEVCSTYGKKTPKIISNVVYVNCKYHGLSMVGNQFREYYIAYNKKKDYKNICTVRTESYKTKDQAEKRRREVIALNSDNNFETLFIERFSVLCDD